jgi:hypothetical protein
MTIPAVKTALVTDGLLINVIGLPGSFTITSTWHIT